MTKRELTFLFTAVEMVRHTSWGLENAVSHAKAYVARLEELIPENGKHEPAIDLLPAIGISLPEKKRRGRAPRSASL